MELIGPLAKHFFILRDPVKAESSDGSPKVCGRPQTRPFAYGCRNHSYFYHFDDVTDTRARGMSLAYSV